jgi:hypothetical protein
MQFYVIPQTPMLCSNFYPFNTAASEQRPALKTPQEMQCANQKMQKMQKNARSLANIDKVEFDREG